MAKNITVPEAAKEEIFESVKRDVKKSVDEVKAVSASKSKRKKYLYICCSIITGFLIASTLVISNTSNSVVEPPKKDIILASFDENVIETVAEKEQMPEQTIQDSDYHFFVGCSKKTTVN